MFYKGFVCMLAVRNQSFGNEKVTRMLYKTNCYYTRSRVKMKCITLTQQICNFLKKTAFL